MSYALPFGEGIFFNIFLSNTCVVVFFSVYYTNIIMEMRV